MVRIEYGRFGSTGTRLVRASKPRQEICSSLKWICFLINLTIVLVGVVFVALGVYSYLKDPRGIASVEDVLLNASLVIVLLGVLVLVVSITGLFGALRENPALLKISVWFGTLCFVVLVLLTFGSFFLFYSDPNENVYINTILNQAVTRYHLNSNVADVMDYLQETMECCGIRSLAQGYRDWQLNEQFVCNETNPFPERCGVPFSCCKKIITAEGALAPSSRSLQCWKDALKRRPHDVEADLHVRGCMVPLKQAFEKNAIIAAASVAMALIVGCLYVFMEYVLARQIEYQHFLLNREARRAERQRRRDLREKAKREKAKAQEEPVYAEPGDLAKDVKQSRKVSQNSHRSVSPQKRPQKDVKEAKQWRRARSAAPADPNDRVAKWVMQQSDFVRNNKNKKP